MKFVVFSALIAVALCLPVEHGTKKINDPDCPDSRFANWANPGNYFAEESNCHAFRVCDLNCDSTIMCCPFHRRTGRQMIWDAEACECVIDEKAECSDDPCTESPTIPIYPQPDPIPAGHCWRNFILYQVSQDILDAEGRPVSYFIAQPSVAPFDPTERVFCPSEPNNPNAAVFSWRQYFDINECACVGEVDSERPEDGLCIDMDHTADLANVDEDYINFGNDPRGVEVTHRGVQLRAEGYYFNGLEGTCLEFPYFKSTAFWWPGFSLSVENFRGFGVLISNGDTAADSTIRVEVAETANGQGTVFTCWFDTLETTPLVATFSDIHMIDDANDYTWSLQLHFCHRRGKFTFIAIATPTVGAPEEVRADSHVTGHHITLRDCPLAFGCDEHSTNNFRGTIEKIQMHCAECSLA